MTELLAAVSVLFALTAFSSAAQSIRTVNKDGSITINTTEISGDFIGHHATTPVEITVLKGKIKNVTALPSDETPSFYEMAVAVLKSFIGMTVEEAAKAEIDAVSGATMSSNALISNVKEGLKYVNGDPSKKSK